MAQDKPKLNKDEQSFDAAQDELKTLQLKCEEYLNGWKRERADFLNYKKDEMERAGSLAKYANEDIILNILPVLDNLYLAEAHINDDGLSQVIKQFQDLLAKEGIEAIEVLGKPFDPNIMEAIEEVENSGHPMSAESTTETVAEEVQKGYLLNGKLIRVAKVKISK